MYIARVQGPVFIVVHQEPLEGDAETIVEKTVGLLQPVQGGGWSAHRFVGLAQQNGMPVFDQAPAGPIALNVAAAIALLKQQLVVLAPSGELGSKPPRIH